MTHIDASTNLADRANCCRKPPPVMYAGAKQVFFMSQREDLSEMGLHGIAHATISDTDCPIKREYNSAYPSPKLTLLRPYFCQSARNEAMS